jgi:hypothetical protein
MNWKFENYGTLNRSFSLWLPARIFPYVFSPIHSASSYLIQGGEKAKKEGV